MELNTQTSTIKGHLQAMCWSLKSNFNSVKCKNISGPIIVFIEKDRKMPVFLVKFLQGFFISLVNNHAHVDTIHHLDDGSHPNFPSSEGSHGSFLTDFLSVQEFDGNYHTRPDFVHRDHIFSHETTL